MKLKDLLNVLPSTTSVRLFDSNGNYRFNFFARDSNSIVAIKQLKLNAVTYIFPIDNAKLNVSVDFI
jgi:hypothetical protein